jgi:hypothetical protein
MQNKVVEIVNVLVKGTNHVRSILRQMQKENRDEESARSDHEEWTPCTERHLLSVWDNGSKLPERQKVVMVYLLERFS